MNRETWLEKMTGILRPMFKEVGYTVPRKVKTSCGWTSKGAKQSAKNTRVGECWSEECSTGGNHEIFISPAINDTIEVSATLVHELIHATIGVKNKHNKVFSTAARRLGLTGKMTATIPSPELSERLNALSAVIGPYPHDILAPMTTGKKTQGTRLIKITCPQCGYTARTTASWIEQGLPTCPCGETME
jgi:hypothetical protein